MRRLLVLTLLALGLLASSASAQTAPTLTAPAAGAYLINSPSFSGADGHDGDSLTVNVYRGATPTGTPVGATSAVGAGDKYATALAAPLPQGNIYTAQTSETAADGTVTQSAPVTFTVAPANAGISLALASTDPVRSAAIFTGEAPVGTGDAQTIHVSVYAGSDTSKSPVGNFTGTEDASGHFTINAAGLASSPDSTFTAVASQSNPDGSTGSSHTLTFNVKSQLTMTAPADKGSLPQTAVSFGGALNTNPGISQRVNVSLYRGTRASGKASTHSATLSNGNWHLAWPARLPVGTYTVTASQDSDSGTPLTVTHTFTVTPPGQLSGTPKISRSGLISARLACKTASGRCSGSLLILTRRGFRPVKGGPNGRLTLLFRRYSVKAGGTGTVTARLGTGVLNLLRHSGAQRLEVINVYTVGTKLTEQTATTAPVRVGRP